MAARKRAPRRPTYGAAMRLARIVHGLLERPRGWAFSDIENELRISERTLLRYLASCRRERVDNEGRPVLETVNRGGYRLLRFAERTRLPESGAYDLVFLYFAMSVLRFLDGTVIKDGIEGLWERFCLAFPQRSVVRAVDLPRKLFAVPYAPKDYRDFDDVLDGIVQCLVYQHRMRIDYAGLRGDGKVHEVDPYTLVLYRGGLYLIGHSHRAGKILTFAVERIRRADKLRATFDYPRGYSPEKYTEGTFGLIGGSETRVEIEVMDPETIAYLKSRRIHPTQALRERRDGTSILSLTVRGTAELQNWVLGFGPHLKLLSPRSLREEVSSSLAGGAALYR